MEENWKQWVFYALCVYFLISASVLLLAGGHTTPMAFHQLQCAFDAEDFPVSDGFLKHFSQGS